ncbi:MAG: hypothetical protein KDD82_12830 [Planctomycetes bacterium]|nr:hypothetical protein [Planctomycetota bacterium]
MPRSFLALICVAAFAGCPAADPAQTPAEPATPAAPSADTPAPAVGGSHAEPTTQVYDVVCGCQLEAVGHCGEYAKVDGAFVEIVGDHGLGEMPFCGKEGLKAEISGHASQGKLHAHSVKIVE